MSRAAPIQLLDRIGRAYGAVMRFSVPPSMASDRELQNQARMFLISHYLGPVLGLSVPAAFFAVDATPGYELVVLSASILAFWLFPFMLRRGWSYRWLVRLSIINLNFTIFWSCFHYGGVQSPTLVWVLIIPILSVLYIGGEERQKRELVCIDVTCALVFVTAYLLLAPPPNDIPRSAMELLGAVSALAVMCYIALMAVYYARIFDAGVDLEREVARRRLMTIELERSVEAAERASSSKSEFLARMTHELRSPLNAIIGYGELLVEEFEDQEDRVIQSDLERILEAGGYLSRMIDMILSLAKIDAGRMPVNAAPCRLSEVITEVAGTHAALIEARGNALRLAVAPEVEEVCVDRCHLGQIVSTVLVNAAQHTEGGTIAIEVRACAADGVPFFELICSDTGSGIEPGILPVIFETFLIDREAAGGRYGGTGLALAVARKLCEAMGGTISAASVEGEGSTFTIRLPVAPPEPAERPSDDAAQPSLAEAA